MQRLASPPRPDWPAVVESQGLHFHSIDDEPYWDESAYYSFTSAEIDLFEKATYALQEMCLEAVQHVIDEDRFELFQVPPQFVDFVVQSWKADEQSIYGRFDFSYDGDGPPHLLEFNADTPTALLEAAVIQWYWLKDTHPAADQFNTIHERLIEAWKALRKLVMGPVHFASQAGHLEDYMTVNYLRDTAMQAGFETVHIDMEEIGWNSTQGFFVDRADRCIQTIFKLYPWEWMLKESFGVRLLTAATRWIEPPWKVLLSNKAILVVLHELFPDSPYLLGASFEPMEGNYIRKPTQAREGANVALFFKDECVMETEGPYEGGPVVYQEVKPLPNFGGNYPVIGSWLVNGYSCGIGIREDTGPITRNTSRFVPHLFLKE